MSRANPERPAHVFAALGDSTRLALLERLSSAEPASIAKLTHGTKLTRQAVSKHLRVLEIAGLVHARRSGRESLYKLDVTRIERTRAYLDRVSARWDSALDRLKNFVERD